MTPCVSQIAQTILAYIYSLHVSSFLEEIILYGKKQEQRMKDPSMSNSSSIYSF